MPDLKFNTVARPSALVRQATGPGHTRTLQTANRQALRHLGLSSNATLDPHGRVLRQLRIQLDVDPSLLATNACLSLSQLYELEDGGDSRFYSESLRRQAGRRVARLLGADWDRMPLENNNPIHMSNVVLLQRSAVHVVQHSSFSDHDMSSSAHLDHTAPTPIASGQLAEPLDYTSLSETLVQAPSAVPAPAFSEASVVKANDWPEWWAVLMVIVVGIGAGYAFALYSPYRLYWPW